MARVPAVARAFAARLPAWLDIVGEHPEKGRMELMGQKWSDIYRWIRFFQILSRGYENESN